MKDCILESEIPVTLVGGGAAGRGDLAAAMAHAPRVVAVDGGAMLALREGVQPDAVVGDFDSLTVSARAQLDPATLWHIAEQNSTDFEKALSRVRAPLMLGVGFTGARLDHQLAALSVLVAYPERPCVLISEHEVLFHCPPHLHIDLPAGAVVSLFPMLPVTGRSTGLKWPIDGLQLAPGGRIGTSNRALGGGVDINIDGVGLIVLLPRTCLEAVIRALLPSVSPAARPHVL